MIATWLSLPIPIMALALGGFYAATAAVLCWLSFSSKASGWIQSFKGVVAPFFGSTSLILGLLIGFLANDIWDRNKQAARAVAAERDGLLTLHILDVISGADSAEMRRAIRDYARAVSEKEWPVMAESGGVPEATSALDAILRAAARPSGPEAASVAIDRTMLDLALRIRSAREDRLVLSNHGSEEVQWAAVLILAVITQIGLAVVHLERPRPQLAALTIFSAGIVTVLTLLAAHDGPFTAPFAIPPDAIAEVATIVPGPP